MSQWPYFLYLVFAVHPNREPRQETQWRWRETRGKSERDDWERERAVISTNLFQTSSPWSVSLPLLEGKGAHTYDVCTKRGRLIELVQGQGRLHDLYYIKVGKGVKKIPVNFCGSPLSVVLWGTTQGSGLEWMWADRKRPIPLLKVDARRYAQGNPQ